MLLRRTVPFALLASLSLLAALLAAPSAGAAKPHKTRVVVSLKFPAFHGSLRSDRRACLGGRRVSMYRKRGRKVRKLGSDRSNARGRWQIRVGKKLRPGKYFATVAKQGACRGGRSKRLAIG